MPNDKGRRRRVGAIRQLPSGRFQARYPGPDGLVRTAPKTFDTETDAARWLTLTEAEMLRGDWFDWSAGEVPLGVVRVTRAVAEVRGQLVIGPPKSEAGKRTVALPEAIVPAVRAHLDTYSERGQRGRVFVGEKGATMRRGNFQAMWAKAIKAAELPKGFHFHDLRHTGNTSAADSGASPAGPH